MPLKNDSSAAVLVPASAKSSASISTSTFPAASAAAPANPVSERSAALTELLATNVAARPAKAAVKTETFFNTTNSVLLVAAVLLLLGGGWYGTRTLLRPAAASVPAAAAQPVPVVAAPAVLPEPAGTAPATKAADKKTAIALPTAPKADNKPAAASSTQPVQVVDLLGAPAKTDLPAPRNADVVPEAPSLGAMKSNLNLATIATSSTTVPRLTRSSNAEPEVLMHKVAPIYPSMARSAHVNGEVIVRMTIGQDGNVKNAVVEKGPPMLRGAVLDAVKQWKYKPYRLDGNPQEVETVVTVKFQ